MSTSISSRMFVGQKSEEELDLVLMIRSSTKGVPRYPPIPLIAFKNEDFSRLFIYYYLLFILLYLFYFFILFFAPADHEKQVCKGLDSKHLISSNTASFWVTQKW